MLVLHEWKYVEHYIISFDLYSLKTTKRMLNIVFGWL